MPGPPCSVGAALKAMTKDERQLFELALSRPDISKSELARRLRAAGHTRVSGWMLRHHHRGECSCRFTTT